MNKPHPRAQRDPRYRNNIYNAGRPNQIGQQFHPMQPVLPQIQATYNPDPSILQYQQQQHAYNHVQQLVYQQMSLPHQYQQYQPPHHQQYQQPHNIQYPQPTEQYQQQQSRVTIFIQRPSISQPLIIQKSRGHQNYNAPRQPLQPQQYGAYQPQVQTDQQPALLRQQYDSHNISTSQNIDLHQQQRQQQPQQPASTPRPIPIHTYSKQSQYQSKIVEQTVNQKINLVQPLNQSNEIHLTPRSNALKEQQKFPVIVPAPNTSVATPEISPCIQPPNTSLTMKPTTPSKLKPNKNIALFDNEELDLSRQVDSIKTEDSHLTITPFSDRNKLILLTEHLAKEVSTLLDKDAKEHERHAKRLFISAESKTTPGHRHEFIVKRPKLKISWNKCDEDELIVAILTRLVETPVEFEWYRVRAHLDCFLRAHVVAGVEEELETDLSYQLALARIKDSSIDDPVIDEEIDQPVTSEQPTEQPIFSTSPPSLVAPNTSTPSSNMTVCYVPRQKFLKKSAPLNPKITDTKTNEATSHEVLQRPELSRTPNASATPMMSSITQVNTTPGDLSSTVSKLNIAVTPIATNPMVPNLSGKGSSNKRGRPRKVVASPGVVQPSDKMAPKVIKTPKRPKKTQANINMTRPVAKAVIGKLPTVANNVVMGKINECIILNDDSEDDLQIVYDNCSSSAKKICKGI